MYKRQGGDRSPFSRWHGDAPRPTSLWLVVAPTAGTRLPYPLYKTCLWRLWARGYQLFLRPPKGPNRTPSSQNTDCCVCICPPPQKIYIFSDPCRPKCGLVCACALVLLEAFSTFRRGPKRSLRRLCNSRTGPPASLSFSVFSVKYSLCCVTKFLDMMNSHCACVTKFLDMNSHCAAASRSFSMLSHFFLSRSGVWVRSFLSSFVPLIALCHRLGLSFCLDDWVSHSVSSFTLLCSCAILVLLASLTTRHSRICHSVLFITRECQFSFCVVVYTPLLVCHFGLVYIPYDASFSNLPFCLTMVLITSECQFF